MKLKVRLPNPDLDDRIPSHEDLEDMEKQEAAERPQWDNKAQYLLSCVGYCVGLGSIWRFPYLCQSHGGDKNHLDVQWLNSERGNNTIFYNTDSPLDELLNPSTWLDAGAQVFYSMSLAFGGHISYSSYNPVHNNCEQDAVIVSLINGCASVYTAIVIYSIIGFRATEQFNTCLNENTLVLLNAFDLAEGTITETNYDEMLLTLNSTTSGSDIIQGLDLSTCNLETFLSDGVEGSGLVFTTFTEAITKMPVSPLWSVLFFITLFCLAISSMFGSIVGVVVSLLDLQIFPKNCPKEVLTGIVCLLSFMIALIFCLRSGNYWLVLFDSYVGPIPLLIIAFCEMTAVVYIYGTDRFNKDIQFMIGHKPNIFWQTMWRLICPLIILVIFFAYFISAVNSELTYISWNPNSANFPKSEILTYPKWIYFVIFILAGIPSLLIPGVTLFKLFQRCCCKRNMNRQNSLCSPRSNGELIKPS